MPWLAAARRAGFTKVGAYVKAPTLDVVTKTLGVLHKQRCCLAPFTLDVKPRSLAIDDVEGQGRIGRR